MKGRDRILLSAVGGALLLWLWRRRQAPLDLADSVVLITGASSGIGRAAAHAFAAQGARVVLVARREAVLRAVQEELAIYAAPTLVVPADVTRDADLEALVGAVLAAWGRIDVLVNNAGLSYGGPLEEMDPARIRALAGVNLYGPLNLTRLVLPVMLRQGGGHIVNVSSVAGLIGAPGMAAYTATRRGLARFSDALRRETAGTGVHVSTVYPSWTATPILGELDVQQLYDSRVLNGWDGIDSPDIPAMAIVDAVRSRRRVVILGGGWMRAGALVERVAPAALDLFWRAVVDIPAYLAAVRRLGA